MTSIVTRGGKGSALTITELDANFTNLNADKVEKTRQVLTTTGQLTGGSSLTADITLGLADSGVSAGTVGNSATQVTPLIVDSKGRITGVGTNVTIAPAFSSVSGKPTTLSGYGISDAQATITGAATTITGSNLTISKVLVSDASGKVSAATTSTTTLGYLDATSSVQNQLDSKQATSGKNAANGYAGLDASGLLSTAVIPDIAIVQYLGSVANQTAMLALTGQKGDWCTRTDDGKVYVITGTTTTLLASWTSLSYPAVPSITINGTAIASGGSATITANTPNTLTIGTGLSGTSFNGSAGVTVAIDGTVATLTGAQTLTNKTISGSSNTLSSIANASLTNSSITFGSTAQALGSTVTALNGVTVGATTPAAATFTTLTSNGSVILGDASVDVVTINAATVTLTNNATIASATAQTLTLTSSAPGAINGFNIGGTTAGTGAFTTLSASSTVSGAGFTTYLASPPAIGGTAAAAGAFTTLSATGAITANTAANNQSYTTTTTGTITMTSGTAGNINNMNVGATTAGTGAFTTLSASSTVSGTGFSTYLASPPAIGGTTASTGRFTTIQSTIATGTAPFTVASTTNVANLNASSLNGATFAAPGAIGSVTAGTGAFTTLSASSTVSGAGFSTYLASPPAIGGTAAAAGAFTTLSASSTVSGTGFSTYLLSPPAIGTTAPAAGKFTDLTSTGNTTIGDASTDTLTINPQTISLINSTAITAASTKTLTLNGGGLTNGLVIDASNNVGIGVTPSAWTLGRAIQISQSASFNGQAGINAAYMNANAYYGSGGWTYINNDLATSYRQYNGTHGWFSAAAGTGAISAFATPTMTLDASGNLGIGTTSAASIAKLTVSNTTTTDNSRIGVVASAYLSVPTFTGTFLQQGDSATTGTSCGLSNAGLGSLLFQNTSVALIWTNGGAPIVFATASSERARIDSSGNLLVGNTAFANGGKMLSYATSVYNTNTYNPLELGSASGATVNHQLQKTTVSTTATVILSTGLYASLVVVFGSDGTNRFIDLVLFGLGNGAVGVVSSFSASGTPAARTYSQSSSTYRLAMASGTYTVQAYAMSMNG